MFVYNGKLNWFSYGQDECSTFVFPARFALMDPVCAYWQWTKDAKGVLKHNMCQYSHISAVRKTTDEYQVSFSFGFYSFEAIIAADLQTMTAIMRNPSGDTGSVALTLQLSDPAGFPSAEVFTGKLNFLHYADNEMITLVIPFGVTEGAPVGLYYEWTVDGAGRRKANHPVNGTFRLVSSEHGTQRATFDDGFYTFQITISNASKQVSIFVNDPRGNNATVNAQRTDFRLLGRKKALIVRCGTGTDNGIFLVRDMLTADLGFRIGDIEMIYFNDEPPTGFMSATEGQQPPTAERFKTKFTTLLSSAREGDVRFLYVDAHGTRFNDEDGSGELDRYDQGWKLAKTDDGRQVEFVYDDWIAETIRSNLAHGVNLTILTSCCLLAGRTNTSYVLLAGCHETQFNVKALQTANGMVDPWMHAIVSAIKHQVSHKRGVPSYSTLFNNAKGVIRRQIGLGTIGSRQYLGPSLDELNPDPRNFEDHTSRQDPQLIFSSEYMDPNSERFLLPFIVPRRDGVTGTSVRFPQDEYPST